MYEGGAMAEYEDVSLRQGPEKALSDNLTMSQQFFIGGRVARESEITHTRVVHIKQGDVSSEKKRDTGVGRVI